MEAGQWMVWIQATSCVYGRLTASLPGLGNTSLNRTRKTHTTHGRFSHSCQSRSPTSVRTYWCANGRFFQEADCPWTPFPLCVSVCERVCVRAHLSPLKSPGWEAFSAGGRTCTVRAFLLFSVLPSSKKKKKEGNWEIIHNTRLTCTQFYHVLFEKVSNILQNISF